MARRDTRRSRNSTRRDALTSGQHTERITAGRVALDAAIGYGRWVRRSPDTRGLATGLALLYPAGSIGYLAAVDPVWFAGLAPPAALAAWVGTYKAHRSHRYSATIAATAGAVPAWLASSAVTGITSWPVFLGYSTAALLAWSGYTWSDVLQQRRAFKAQQVQWDQLATTAGLENSRLVKVEDTRLGQRFRIDIRGTGKTARQLAGSDLAERIAAVLALPAERVRTSTDTSHAGVIHVLIQTVDPWASRPVQPELVPATGSAGDALVPALPSAGRSILDGPVVIGEDPDTGQPLGLTVFGRAGGQHTLIIGATGAGKTFVYCAMTADLTARRDVLVMGIDLGKGTLPAIWGDALDARAGLGADGQPEYAKALKILEWCVTIIRKRSAQTGGRNHKPSPTAPAIVVKIDEMDTVVGANSPIAHKAKPLVTEIHKRGRSAGVMIATAGQRGTVQNTGTKEVHANAGNVIVLRVNRSAEMNSAVPDWMVLGMPDMATYAQGVKGVALVVGDDNTWRAGRVFHADDLDDYAALAARRGRPTATLEPEIAAALDGYTTRHQTATDPVAGLIPKQRTDSTIAEPGSQPGWGVSPDDDRAITRLANGLVREVEARLAGMPAAPTKATSLADLISTKAAMDPDVIRPMLALLAERGEDGARRDELVTATGKPEGTVKRCLRILRDQGRVTARGSTRAARYYLPEHDPDGEAPDETDPEDDYSE